jgi:hypothetical protein
LETTLTHQQKQILKLETQLASGESFDFSELSLQLDDARKHLASLEQGMRRKRAALGVDDQVDLRRLQQDAFLRIRMNALALKERIRDRLRQRKFEIEKLERNYRHSTNGMYVSILAEIQLKIISYQMPNFRNIQSHH